MTTAMQIARLCKEMITASSESMYVSIQFDRRIFDSWKFKNLTNASDEALSTTWRGLKFSIVTCYTNLLLYYDYPSDVKDQFVHQNAISTLPWIFWIQKVSYVMSWNAVQAPIIFEKIALFLWAPLLEDRIHIAQIHPVECFFFFFFFW